MRLVFLGPPGAGKGTQAAFLSAAAGIPTISTGMILREAIANHTELGQMAQEFISKGQLVPDDVVIGIVKDRLAQGDCVNGYILDGFPRTLLQAEALDKMIPDAVSMALELEVPDEYIIERLSGRRECKKCGATYHVTNNPPNVEGKCNRCGEELYCRADDQVETIKKRMSVYHTQTQPIKDYYKSQGKLVCVHGVGDVGDITKALFQAVGLDGESQ